LLKSRASQEFLAIEAVRERVRKIALSQWAVPRDNPRTELWGMDHTRVTLEDIFGPDMHLARVRSMANGVTAMLNARTASVAAL
jgi:hypothetical protein